MDGFVQILQPTLEFRRCADSADEQAIVIEAADHIHVDHRHRVPQRDRWMICEVRRPQQAQLFACERNKQNGTLPLALIACSQPGNFEDAGGSGRVVVGSVMDLSDL